MNDTEISLYCFFYKNYFYFIMTFITLMYIYDESNIVVYYYCVSRQYISYIIILMGNYLHIFNDNIILICMIFFKLLILFF